MTSLSHIKKIELKISHLLQVVVGVAFLVTSIPPTIQAASRIKDIVQFEGVRENLLVGYGLVPGVPELLDFVSNVRLLFEIGGDSAFFKTDDFDAGDATLGSKECVTRANLKNIAINV